MTLDEIREQLLADHARLREISRSVEGEAERLLRGTASTLDALRASLGVLDDSLRAHNTREERLLRDVLPTVDAWGRRREELMDERHAGEHASVGGFLGVCAQLEDPVEAATRAREAIARLLAHVEQEEREFLSADVLSDDFTKIDLGGG